MAERKRHWFLNVWMYLLLLINLGNTLFYLAWSVAIHIGFFDPTGVIYPVLFAFALIKLISIIAMFHWKKWGFWGVFASSAFIYYFSLSDSNLAANALIGPIDALILFGLLHIGKENKAWPQLN